MDQFYEELKKLWMSVEYELNQSIKEKLDDPGLVESITLCLEWFQVVIGYIQLLSLAQSIRTLHE
ncbi:hypothetical protein [Rossellomorea arthrocnemi]|jgi:hypothetical protein|uniref:hypothetical protein n=1 Tax=Rossellomorea arthrocnemi TaxID=2769542 RepID=UPI00191A05A8|nr:hypothetical protein [Rossellomorea arthrocnemi]